MNESILTSIKKLLGITEEYTHFDADIIMHINSVFMILMQLGIGPANGFSISDDSAVWADFLSDATWFESPFMRGKRYKWRLLLSLLFLCLGETNV